MLPRAPAFYKKSKRTTTKTLPKLRMEELKQQLKKVQAKRRTAKRRYSAFQRDVKQIIVLETKISEAFNKLLEKKDKNYSDLSVRARLRETEKLVSKELAQANVASQHYEEYHRQLARELSAAEATVAQAKAAIQEWQKSGKKRLLNIHKSRQEAAWDASRKLPEDYARIQELEWNSIFPPLWSRCGWRSCLMMKSSLRKSFMCQHLTSRFFLQLDIQQLEEEKRRWDPDHFEGTEQKFRGLAAELAGDIEKIIEQRIGGDKYLWEQKRWEWYPRVTDAD